jgi:hypothetical protein
MNAIEKVLIAFFSGIYDEWVTHPWSTEVPTIDACTYRSLRQAVGAELFDAIIARSCREQKLKVLNDFAHADAKDPVLEVLDYLC